MSWRIFVFVHNFAVMSVGLFVFSIAFVLFYDYFLRLLFSSFSPALSLFLCVAPNRIFFIIIFWMIPVSVTLFVTHAASFIHISLYASMYFTNTKHFVLI